MLSTLTIRHRWLRTAISIAVAAIGWRLLAPPAVGGTTSYVVVTGTSMLPRFHAGDVVVLHRERNYHVGEIVAYDNAQLHETVMHRIVAIDGDQYVFRGDNNNFNDSFRPTRSQVVGALWVHLSGVASDVADIERPQIAGSVIGLLCLYALAPRYLAPNRKRRHHHG